MKTFNIARIILLIVWLISCFACTPNAVITCKRSGKTLKRFDSADEGFKAMYVDRQSIVAYVIECEGKQYLLNTNGGIVEIK